MATAQHPQMASSPPQSMQERFFAAERAMQGNDLQQSLMLCQQLIAEREDYAPAYFLLSEIYLRLNQLETSLKFNDFALRFQPDSFDIYFQRGKLMFGLSRWEEAKHAFAKAHAIDPTNAVTVMLQGDVLAQMGEEAQAITLFDKATAIQDLPEILEHKGLSQLRCNDLEGARASFVALLKRLPNHASGLVHLAKLDMVDGETELGVERLRKALMIDPNHHEALAYLSEHLVHENQHEEALIYGRRAIATNPSRLDTVLQALKSFLSTGNISEAEVALRKLLTYHPDNLHVIIRLAAVLAPRGKVNEALILVERALEKVPDNTSLQYTRAALCGEATAPAPEEYVVNVFDSYSGNFDIHLQQVLGYHIPKILSDAIRLLLPVEKRELSLLDLGCGTGLMAEALRDITVFRVGVDLSPKMIEKAIAKGVYTETYIDELVRYMNNDMRNYDMVTAADVLIYVGDLKATFEQVAEHLKPGGYFALSVERDEGDAGYSIRPSGRYAHSAAYLHQMAAAHTMKVVHEAVCDLRAEAGSMLQGTVMILQSAG